MNIVWADTSPPERRYPRHLPPTWVAPFTDALGYLYPKDHAYHVCYADLPMVLDRYDVGFVLLLMQDLEGLQEAYLPMIEKAKGMGIPVAVMDGDSVGCHFQTKMASRAAQLEVMQSADVVFMQHPRTLYGTRQLTSTPVVHFPFFNAMAEVLLREDVGSCERDVISTPLNYAFSQVGAKNVVINYLVMSALRREFPQYQYKVLSGSKEPDHLMGHLGLGDMELQAGSGDKYEVKELLKRSKLFINVDFSASGGMTTIEASAAGTPTICLRETPAGDILGTTILYRYDVEAAVEAARRLLVDDAAWRRASTTAREKSKLFTTSAARWNIESVFTRLGRPIPVGGQQRLLVADANGQAFALDPGKRVLQEPACPMEEFLTLVDPHVWTTTYEHAEWLMTSGGDWHGAGDYLEYVDVWLLHTPGMVASLNKQDPERVLKSVRYAQEHGCLVGAFVNDVIPESSPYPDYDYLNQFDFIEWQHPSVLFAEVAGGSVSRQHLAGKGKARA